MSTRLYSETQTIFFCVLLCSLIFILDLYIPLGVSIGVSYVVVILFSLKISRFKNAPIVFGVLATLLTELGYFFSEELGIEWMVLSNRALSVFVIWVTVLLGLRIRKTRSKLVETIEQFHVLTEQSPLMMWQANIAGNWIFASKGWLNFTCNGADQTLNENWLEYILPEDRTKVEITFNQLIQQLTPFQINCRLKRYDGEYRWVTLQGNACYAEHNVITGFLGTALDIHDKKTTELLLEDTRQKYYHQEKMASLGTLTSGILHEIGNPLASILGLLNEIQETLKSEPLSVNERKTIDNYLSMTFAELNRLSQLSQNVSRFSNMTANDDSFIDLNDVIERTCDLMRHDERMWKIQLLLQLDRNIPAIKVINNSVIQVLQNLIGNAIDACEKQQDAVITVSSAANVDKVFVTVKDNGQGMSTNTLSQAGQEFFTTKSKGTGLGLSICYSLINKMNGHLEISSVEGQGSEITITLPIS